MQLLLVDAVPWLFGAVRVQLFQRIANPTLPRHVRPGFESHHNGLNTIPHCFTR